MDAQDILSSARKLKKGGCALQPVKGPPTYGTFIQFNVVTLINKIGRMLYDNRFFSQCYRDKTNGKFGDH